jgi:hypothetical protein
MAGHVGGFLYFVIPAKAGTQEHRQSRVFAAIVSNHMRRCSWVPAFAGMTVISLSATLPP